MNHLSMLPPAGLASFRVHPRRQIQLVTRLEDPRGPGQRLVAVRAAGLAEQKLLAKGGDVGDGALVTVVGQRRRVYWRLAIALIKQRSLVRITPGGAAAHQQQIARARG